MEVIPYALVVGSIMCAQDHMLIYRRYDHLKVIGYSKSNFAGCMDIKKSTLGYVFLLANGAVSWNSAK
ncbi:hypothetical protein CR513_38915, partial [Mucuna pruriens]